MFSTWVQNHPSDKLGTYSQTFLDILRLFLDFPRTFSEFVGRKQNYVGRFQNRVGRKINSVGHNPKNVHEITRTTCCFITNDVLYL